MTIAEIEGLWTELPPAYLNQLSGKRIPSFPAEEPVYAAVDSSGHRHVLVQVPPDSPRVQMRSTYGLNVVTEELQVSNFHRAVCIDLECLTPKHFRTFAALNQDLLEALLNARDRTSTVKACLDRWRSFWLVNQAGLTREVALGLFGELWFLARWLEPITEAKLVGWQGPEGARHDFQWDNASFEVKTCATSASLSPIHFISNIDQLSEPERGALYLFSLHVCDDLLASNNLSSLIDLIRTMLSGDEHSLNLFCKKLADVGYSPAHAEYYKRPLRIIAEELYVVGSNFPRLTRRSFGTPLPDGVQSVSYSLSMAACGQWKVATAPTDAAAKLLLQTL
jgi:hypothetical protein